MPVFETKITEEMRLFESGSRRGDRTGKGRYDLLPFHGIQRLADLYERGGIAYGDRNWEKGQPLSSYADSTLRHAFQAAAGLTDEDHWAAVAWNALAVIDHRERIARGELPAELDDLPRPTVWVKPTYAELNEDIGPHDCNPRCAAHHRKLFPVPTDGAAPVLSDGVDPT